MQVFTFRHLYLVSVNAAVSFKMRLLLLEIRRKMDKVILSF